MYLLLPHIIMATENHAKRYFLALSAELRNAIYEFALVSPHPIDLWACLPNRHCRTNKEVQLRSNGEETLWQRDRVARKDTAARISVPLLRTCKQIYAEAVSILYGQNKFRFTHHGGWVVAQLWLHNIGQRHRDWITDISINGDDQVLFNERAATQPEDFEAYIVQDRSFTANTLHNSCVRQRTSTNPRGIVTDTVPEPCWYYDHRLLDGLPRLQRFSFICLSLSWPHKTDRIWGIITKIWGLGQPDKLIGRGVDASVVFATRPGNLTWFVAEGEFLRDDFMEFGLDAGNGMVLESYVEPYNAALKLKERGWHIRFAGFPYVESGGQKDFPPWIFEIGEEKGLADLYRSSENLV
ncbi:hypothetical protein BDY21DRAFT_340035 [Lineolata rhizophorae]|uniref:DUF7730 domain-containing protein n=1 Tax=Lineolata rhizophorae TaxID=578093 RepID=A0A6A6P599_9PEZI|nr:hypothetical protein BDY21DRAFT_340035 [Lineolata rhizophorae]